MLELLTPAVHSQISGFRIPTVFDPFLGSTTKSSSDRQQRRYETCQVPRPHHVGVRSRSSVQPSVR